MKDKVLILGIGNILLGDEGIGVHAARYLEEQPFPDHVDVLDGGTGGFHLLDVFQSYLDVIMIDAALDNRPAGTVNLLQPKFAKDFPKSLSAHEIGLKDLLESASLLGTFPRIYLITVSVDNFQDIDMELSEEVKKAIPEIHAMVLKVLEGIGLPEGR